MQRALQRPRQCPRLQELRDQLEPPCPRKRRLSRKKLEQLGEAEPKAKRSYVPRKPGKAAPAAAPAAGRQTSSALPQPAAPAPQAGHTQQQAVPAQRPLPPPQQQQGSSLPLPGALYHPQGLSTSLSAMMQHHAALGQQPRSFSNPPQAFPGSYAQIPPLLVGQPPPTSPDTGRVLVANLLAAFSQPQDAAAFAAPLQPSAWPGPAPAQPSVHLSPQQAQQGIPPSPPAPGWSRPQAPASLAGLMQQHSQAQAAGPLPPNPPLGIRPPAAEPHRAQPGLNPSVDPTSLLAQYPALPPAPARPAWRCPQPSAAAPQVGLALPRRTVSGFICTRLGSAGSRPLPLWRVPGGNAAGDLCQWPAWIPQETMAGVLPVCCTPRQGACVHLVTPS